MNTNNSFLNDNSYSGQRTLQNLPPEAVQNPPPITMPYTPRKKKLTYLIGGLGGALLGNSSAVAAHDARVDRALAAARNKAESAMDEAFNAALFKVRNAKELVEAGHAVKPGDIKNLEGVIMEEIDNAAAELKTSYKIPKVPLQSRLIRAGIGAGLGLLGAKLLIDTANKDYIERKREELRRQKALEKIAVWVPRSQYENLVRSGGFATKAKYFLGGAGALGAGLKLKQISDRQKMRRMGYYQ